MQVVVDPRSVLAHLPNAVLAFFYLSVEGEDSAPSREEARWYQRTFLSDYPGQRADKVPVLRLDLTAQKLGDRWLAECREAVPRMIVLSPALHHPGL